MVDSNCYVLSMGGSIIEGYGIMARLFVILMFLVLRILVWGEVKRRFHVGWSRRMAKSSAVLVVQHQGLNFIWRD